MTIARTWLTVGIALVVAGCASGPTPERVASGPLCPAGTVLVCTGLYEPERELAPSCACADLTSSR